MAFGAGFAFGQVDPEPPPGAMATAEEAPVDQVPVPDPAPIVEEVPAMVTPAEEAPPPTWEETMGGLTNRPRAIACGAWER